jgi:hypothetical protein
MFEERMEWSREDGVEGHLLNLNPGVDSALQSDYQEVTDDRSNDSHQMTCSLHRTPLWTHNLCLPSCLPVRPSQVPLWYVRREWRRRNRY